MTTTMRAVVLTASPYTMMLARSELGRISIASRRQESYKRRGSA